MSIDVVDKKVVLLISIIIISLVPLYIDHLISFILLRVLNKNHVSQRYSWQERERLRQRWRSMTVCSWRPRYKQKNKRKRSKNCQMEQSSAITCRLVSQHARFTFDLIQTIKCNISMWKGPVWNRFMVCICNIEPNCTFLTVLLGSLYF